jgi:L-asparagine oxygenase
MEQVIDRVTLDPYADLEGFLDECATGAAEWPWLLRSVLRSFARWGNDGGALVLTGLPVEQYLPPTPVGQLQTLAGRPGITEKLLAGVAACFGAELIAYAQHLGGAVFQDVGPDPKEELVQSSASSIKALLSHTEDAFHPYRPRFLMLACERPDHERRALVIPKDSDIFHS